LFLCWPNSSAAQEPVPRFIAPTPPLSPAEQQKKFHLPPGFRIELVAAEPQIRKPINLAFDAAARLWVSGSVAYPFPATPEKRPADRIVVLEDSDRDGEYEPAREFATGLNIPVGLAPLSQDPQNLLAFSIPHVWRWTDGDRDGRADRRELLYGPFGYDDTHGLPNGFTWWIDGWVYASQGQTNASQPTDRRGRTISLEHGRTFRFRPDGTRIEPFAFGQVNPFGLCFDPLGNLYTADSNSRPGTLLLAGAWYPTLQQPHDGLGWAPALMNHYHDSTGIAGIAYYAAEHFPAEYRDTLFIGNPVTGRVNHDRIHFSGATARAEQLADFLTCDDPWFRPVDLQLGPDGALYIADFYNRIIAHTEVPLDHAERDRQRGRIWRVVATSAAKPDVAPDLTRADLAQLLDYLRHANLTVRTLATHQLVQRMGASAVAPLKNLLQDDSHPWQRAHGLWVLQRLGMLDTQTIRHLAADPDRRVRVHLLKALTEELSAAGAPMVRQICLAKLDDPDALVRRAAVEMLARQSEASHVALLVDLWKATPADDAMLIHAIRIALRNQLRSHPDLFAIARALGDPESERRVADASLGVPTPAAAEFLFAYLRRRVDNDVQFEEFMEHAARFLKSERLAELHRWALGLRDRDVFIQTSSLRALHRAKVARGGDESPALHQWAVDLANELLSAERERLVFEGLEFAWDLELRPLGARIDALVQDRTTEPSLRWLAMDALGNVDPALAMTTLDAIAGDIGESLDDRAKAGETLAKIASVESRDRVQVHLKTAPLHVARRISRVLALSTEGAELLLNMVAQGTLDGRLLLDAQVEQHLRLANVPNLEQRVDELLRGLPPEDATLENLMAERRQGFLAATPNRERGAQLFEKNCAVCHQLRGRGAQVGPALDGIGLRGLDRLLEDVLSPSQNLDRRFQSSIVLRYDGRFVTGLAVRDEGQALVLVDEQGREVRIAHDDIDQQRTSRLSPMPANLAEQLSPTEFYDLLAFLLQETETAAGKSGGS
jgi:putative heme-binding domain-containing protein